MAQLTLSNISKSYGTNVIFKNVSFTIEENHRIGLVGVNGSGKTTLFKVICEQIPYESGEIFKSKNLKIGYVEQFTCANSKNTVFDEVLSVQENLLMLENEIENLQNKISKATEIKTSAEITNENDSLETMLLKKHNLEVQYEELGGYTYKSIAKSTLIGLGFEEKELQLMVNELSGGQKTKLTLAKLLFSSSNLLLLDEPTNNLDIESIEWLENFLMNYKGSYIVISHDRYFLDKVTKETFEMEDKKLSTYKGNYSKYVKLKEEKNKTLSRKYETTQKEIHRLEKVIEQQKTWSQENNYKTIKSKKKVIERLEDTLEKPDKEMEKMDFRFEAISGGNKEVLTVKALAKSFENKKLFENVNMTIYKGERVFLVGPNGTGKTTFLKIIQGLIKADDGEFLVGNNMKIAYYSQGAEELDDNKTVLEYVWDAYDKLKQTEVRKALAKFLFKGEDVNKKIQSLSGGERARVALLMIMLSKSNFLILDEPTNHLDILAREALENALAEYDGTMLIVSHDRYFINKLSSKIYHITKNGAQEFIGNYENYIENHKEQEIKNEKPSNNSYKEKKQQESIERKKKNDMKRLEESIAINEEKIHELETLLFTDEYATDYQKAMEISNLIEELKKENEEKYEEWYQKSMT